MLNHIKQYPHCDMAVLHAPGECDYCDMHPDWQELRSTWKINFTGHHDPDKSICPAEKNRTLSTINEWGGNRAQPLISKQQPETDTKGVWAWFPWLKD